MIDDILFNVSIGIIKLIYNSDFDKLNNLGCCEKLTVENIKYILDSYGGELDEVDEENYHKHFKYIKLHGCNIYKTYLDLFIDKERSDLTLICDVFIENEDVKIVIDDLHVL